jgi:glycosyltransferase involved in cell wall biosynthesis
MRILWVKAGKLLPVDTGGKIRSYNILRHLARSHAVTLLTYYGGKRDEGYEAAIENEFPGAKTIYTAAPDADALAQGFDYLKRLVDPAPYAVSKFTHSNVRMAVSRLMNSGEFDAAVCDFLSASQNFAKDLPVPTVLFQHNVETALWKRMASTETHPIKKFFFGIEARKMARYERQTLGRLRHVIAVSENDRGLMLEMDPTCHIVVVPTGVDTKKFPVAPPSKLDPPRIVFTGSMDWEPNIDAVDYFCQQIWPKILGAYSNARFQIVGRSPHPKVKRLASESIEVTGTVPSVADYLRDAAVVVVPLRIGGGTRLKIYEAMAMGKAMVSTSIGAEGLDVTSGRDIILADDAATFADSILLLLRDEALRRKYEAAATELASRFDWSKIVEQFAGVLHAAADAHRPAAATPAKI